jgi:hypothetical protein
LIFVIQVSSLPRVRDLCISHDDHCTQTIL